MPPSGGTRWPLLVASLLLVELARTHRISPAPTVTEATVFTGPLPPLVSWQPRHIHLALAEEEGGLTVTWSTLNSTQESQVIVETGQGERQYNGTSEVFQDGGKEQRRQWIHRVKVPDLSPSQTHQYRVGSSQGWSELLSLRTLPRDTSSSPTSSSSSTSSSPTIALFGDMGTDNAAALPHLQTEAARGSIDAVIHVGDMAYDMAEHGGRRGDHFMEQVEPIASLLPYMTCPGNHEWHYNFSNYRARFGASMPGGGDDMFYSFHMGPVHFVSINTEFYYYLNYGVSQVISQYKWLEQHLASVDRKTTPWLVVFGHRPMYCTNDDRDDCTKFETRTRTGLPVLNWWGLEDLLVQYGVDLAVWAHEHSYERLLPTYNRTVVASPDPRQPYLDPRAPVHITTGSAGCREKHDHFIPSPPAWSAFRSSQYGYTRMKAANETHLYLEQVDVETAGQPVVDRVWIVQHNHGPFRNLL